MEENHTFYNQDNNQNQGGNNQGGGNQGGNNYQQNNNNQGGGNNYQQNNNSQGGNNSGGNNYSSSNNSSSGGSNYSSSNNSSGGNSSYGGGNSGGSSGGYKQPSGGNYQKGGYKKGGGNFKPKSADVSHIPVVPYFPYGIILKTDKPAPPEALDCLQQSIIKLNSAGFTVRYTPDPQLPYQVGTKQEATSPFESFNELENGPERLFYSSKFNKQMIDAVDKFGPEMTAGKKSLIACDIAIMVGLYNTSPVRVLFIYSPDGATTIRESSKDTGWIRSVIGYAEKLGIPVANIANPDGTHQLIESLVQTATKLHQH